MSLQLSSSRLFARRLLSLKDLRDYNPDKRACAPVWVVVFFALKSQRRNVRKNSLIISCSADKRNLYLNYAERSGG